MGKHHGQASPGSSGTPGSPPLADERGAAAQELEQTMPDMLETVREETIR
jgi:hypothetical protein